MKTLFTFIKMKIFRSLRGKLILLFLTISLLPLLTMGILAYTQAKKALETQMTHQLIAVRDIKANQIERYFRERLEDVKVMSNNPSTIAAVRAFHNAVKTGMKALDTNEGEAIKHYRSLYLNKPNLVNANDGSAYSAVHAQYHQMFKEYQKAHGYHDIFLVEPHIGAIIYTVGKENDFGTSLINGLYANTNLGEAFKETAAATRRDFTLLKDFAHYAPSNGAASFVASPIFDESQLVGVLLFQLPINQIDTLMQEGSGLGETGETLLISSDDFILRSNSRFFEESTLLKRKVDTEATRASAAGKTGVKSIIDYRGEPTLIAHTPLSIPNVKWSLNAKIDQAEAFAVVHHMLTLMLLIMGIIAVIVVTVALFIGKSIVKPILTMTQIARQLAAGNMNQTIEIKSQDEIGLMGNAFQQMIAHLGQVIDDIVKVSKGLAAGNLHVTPQAEYQGDFIQVKNALETGLSNLRLVVDDIVQISQGLVEGKRRVIAKAEYNGDFIPIKNSLETASVKLAETTAQNNIQNWLKTGQTQLNDKMRGEQDIIQLAKNIITFLAKYLEMSVGVFYLLEEGEMGKEPGERSQVQRETENGPVSETARLKLVASYAYTHRKGISNEFIIGEGLVGQAALEQKQILITKVPEDYYIQIQSGLGKALPRNVLIQPLKYENALKGIIELASFKTLTDIQLELIAQITPSIGIAVNTAESRYRVQALLQQSQTQTEELQSQAEELQTQSEELQTQSEELQTQQEELTQTNEALEQRTKELEQQRNDIQAKNIALEQSQQTLETKMQELKQASQYKSEFLANMSHELRTPLNSLLILAQLLADNKTGNLTDKQVEYTKTIHSAGSDLLTLINDILDLSKVEAGKMEVHLEELLLTDLVERFEKKFHPVAENKGLAFHITVAKDLPPVINTDVQRLQQIINNLLSNAFKFTTTGEIKLTMQRPSTGDNLSEMGLDVAKTIAFSVTDTGIGIPEDKKRVIFEAFQQVDGTTSRRYGGTGLGLSISRQFARLLGGELQLHSEEGNGSTFTLYLPETRPSKEELVQNKFSSSEEQQYLSSDIQDSESPTPSPTEKALTPTGTQVETPSFEKTGFLETTEEIIDDRAHMTSEEKSLLIIEDDQKFSTILADLARQKGFKCMIAQDGRTGLQLAEEYQPHTIILDVGLPQLDGWTVMEKLKDNPDTRHIPVHFISASEPSLDATKMGAIGYLHKPVNMEQLGEAFKKIEQFITKTMKNLLVVVDNEVHQQQIQDLVSSENVKITFTATKAAALQHLQEASFDCIILDMDIEQRSGTGLLKQMQNQQGFCQTPFIIYTERELTSSEEALLLRCADKLPIKSVSSQERLLDEVTLFLHQLEANLPVEKRNMLRMVHDKAAILKHKKVLIVDDDVRNVYALATVLEDKDMEVVCGKNGKEALALLEEEIAIVLMDIMMPEMDGYEAIQEIRKQPSYRKLPIIALTAKAMKGDKAKCIEAGANDYLSKPVDTEKLISLMRVWLYR